MTTADVYRALWRHKFFIAILTAALVAGAGYLTSRQQKTYQASTLVRVQQQVDDPTQAFGALATGAMLARTYADIATTSTIAERIAGELGNKVRFREIAGHVSAAAVPDLDLLWIHVRGESPERVQLIANTAPIGIESFIAQAGTPHERVIIVEPATLPTSPVAPNMARNLIFAFFLGLILNGGLALLATVLREPVGNSEQVERATGLPVLVTIPPVRFGRSSTVESAGSDRRRDSRLAEEVTNA